MNANTVYSYGSDIVRKLVEMSMAKWHIWCGEALMVLRSVRHGHLERRCQTQCGKAVLHCIVEGWEIYGSKNNIARHLKCLYAHTKVKFPASGGLLLNCLSL